MSEQSLQALKVANKTRIEASVVRHKVAARLLTLEQALDEPGAQSLTIGRLLLDAVVGANEDR